MKRIAMALLAACLPLAAQAGELILNVYVDGIGKDGSISPRYALCKPTPDGKNNAGENIRPTIRWSGAPLVTKSYAVVMMDPDVPEDFTDANKAGKSVSSGALRKDFYHWALIDIPADVNEVRGGIATNPPSVGTQLPNSLGSYVSDPKQFGGPCPPWNDEIVHHYHYSVLALNVNSLNLQADASAQDVFAAAEGHILARGETVGTYTLNNNLRGKKTGNGSGL